MSYATSGIYMLKIVIESPIECEIGKLGKNHFQTGYYGYIGSALLGNRNPQSKSPGPLLQRVQRHVKPAKEKKMHWHIDYLLSSPHVSIESIILLPTLDQLECDVVRLFNEYAIDSIPNFGCSDCKCLSHLLYFGKEKSKILFQ